VTFSCHVTLTVSCVTPWELTHGQQKKLLFIQKIYINNKFGLNLKYGEGQYCSIF